MNYGIYCLQPDWARRARQPLFKFGRGGPGRIQSYATSYPYPSGGYKVYAWLTTPHDHGVAREKAVFEVLSDPDGVKTGFAHGFTRVEGTEWCLHSSGLTSAVAADLRNVFRYVWRVIDSFFFVYGVGQVIRGGRRGVVDPLPADLERELRLRRTRQDMTKRPYVDEYGRQRNLRDRQHGTKP